MLSGGLANTWFVGPPRIETFYGPSFLGIGTLVDQLGTYKVLSTVGVVVAATFSSGGPVRPGAAQDRVLRAVPGAFARAGADSGSLP